mmetsp:Transcript_7309/g.14976  ORF Transcript_7309/g.14976 Transcript_7309/m.14976 type:complete len:100 (-) Transcript_7309:289-588(-)
MLIEIPPGIVLCPLIGFDLNLVQLVDFMFNWSSQGQLFIGWPLFAHIPPVQQSEVVQNERGENLSTKTTGRHLRTDKTHMYFLSSVEYDFKETPSHHPG